MNTAAIKGRSFYSWWPGWQGECCAIVAGGPSVKKMDLSVLKERIHVIAIKESVEKCPWAEVCYGCDAAWWLHRKGLPQFRGIKIFHGVGAANRWADLHRAEIVMGDDRMLVEHPLKLGNGGNSGFQALNLAVQFGATDIILIGYDCQSHGNDLHWYGRNTWLNASNPMQSNYNRWKKGFEIAKRDIDKMGVTVVNASAESELKCFRKTALSDIMREWGL